MRLRFPLAAQHAADLDLMRGARRLVLAGAGIHAAPAILALRQHGLAPELVCDNAPAKQGRLLAGVPVVAPEAAGLSTPGTVAVITSAFAYVEEIAGQLRRLGCPSACTALALYQDFSYYRSEVPEGLSPFHFDLNRYLSSGFHALHPGSLVVENLDVMVTERCSLRCRDCSNLMQYYAAPRDLDVDEAVAALDRVMASVDHVLEFRVLGGETFLNPHAHRFLDALARYPNASRTVVYTNGTLLPRPELLARLRREDLIVRITDYGAASRRVEELARLLEAEGVTFEREPCERWQDCAAIAPNGLSPEALETQHGACEVRAFLTLLKGRVYACPFAANAQNLGAVPDGPDAYVWADGRLDAAELRRGLGALLAARTPTSACRYCAGRHLPASIPSAVQIPRPRPFTPCP